MYVLKIKEHRKKPETRVYHGELTDEVREQWRRVFKFSNIEYQLLPYQPEEGEQCQKTKQ